MVQSQGPSAVGCQAATGRMKPLHSEWVPARAAARAAPSSLTLPIPNAAGGG